MPGEIILVVEDNDIMREGLRDLIEAQGYQVLAADSGITALRQMEATGPDLILSDISMPEMDGYTFYKQVRARSEWVTIPFIFLTALGDRDNVFASKKVGVEDYLIKPIDPQGLITTIRSRLDRSRQLMLAQLHQSYEASLILLANAIEMRDKYTRGHVERVTKYAGLIAERLGWVSPTLRSLRFGAILHDIGKIYIGERILCKPEPLDREEWEEMKSHAAIGAKLLERVPYLTGAIPVIRYHHERWDGQGYPEGLAGDEIPLGARIVAVADSFDAMTTERPYHRAYSPQQALREISANSGIRYDPVIVEAFLAEWVHVEPEIPST